MHSQQTHSLVVLVLLAMAIIAPSATFARSVSTPASNEDDSAQQQQHSSRLLSVLALGATNEDVDKVTADVATNNNRQRRQAYNVPNSDYYNNYYNDYYNNYYNQLNNGNRVGNSNSAYRPSAPSAFSADRFDGNSNNLAANNYNSIDSGFASNGRPQQQVINGQKYVYTPLFQYKATQGHHEKLFVPNLFG